MFMGARKKWEMDWQLVASYFTVKSKDIFCSVCVFYKSEVIILVTKDLTRVVISYENNETSRR